MGKCCSVCVSDASVERTQQKNEKGLKSLQQSNNSFNSNHHQIQDSQHKPKNGKSADKPISGKNSTHDFVRTFSYPKQDLDESKIIGLFCKYKDDSEDAILADGMEKFCQDLGVDPTEFVVLALAWKFDASQMCRFTRKEFVEGFKALKSDSIKSLRNKFPELEEEVVKDVEKFKDLYRFTFKFGLDIDEGQRALPTNIAVPLWKLVFSKSPPKVSEKWYAYLDDRQVRGISRDTWFMFLNFTETIESDFSNYDDSEAWPSLFDDFVEHEREKAKEDKDEKESRILSGDIK